MDREEEIGRRQAENFAGVIEHGPGLRYSTQTWVVARDRKQRRVFIGGLGGLGVGQMWFDDSDGRHRDTFGYEDAPEREWHGSEWC